MPVTSSSKKKLRRGGDETAVPTLNLNHRLFAAPPKKPEALSEPLATEDDYYTIYRGSITHLVLEKVGRLDPYRLKDMPPEEEEEVLPDDAIEVIDPADSATPESPLSTRSKRPRSLVTEVITEIPEIQFHRHVVPQPRRFRTGDKVQFRRHGRVFGTGECGLYRRVGVCIVGSSF